MASDLYVPRITAPPQMRSVNRPHNSFWCRCSSVSEACGSSLHRVRMASGVYLRPPGGGGYSGLMSHRLVALMSSTRSEALSTAAERTIVPASAPKLFFERLRFVRFGHAESAPDRALAKDARSPFWLISSTVSCSMPMRSGLDMESPGLARPFLAAAGLVAAGLVAAWAGCVRAVSHLPPPMSLREAPLSCSICSLPPSVIVWAISVRCSTRVVPSPQSRFREMMSSTIGWTVGSAVPTRAMPIDVMTFPARLSFVKLAALGSAIAKSFVSSSVMRLSRRSSTVTDRNSIPTARNAVGRWPATSARIASAAKVALADAWSMPRSKSAPTFSPSFRVSAHHSRHLQGFAVSGGSWQPLHSACAAKNGANPASVSCRFTSGALDSSLSTGISPRDAFSVS